MTDAASTAVVPRARIADIVANRNRALEGYDSAYVAMVAASASMEDAGKIAARNKPLVNRYNHHNDNAEKCFLRGLKVPTREEFTKEARRLVDTNAWALLIEMTDLERLMDKKAKDQFNQQLLADPPEVTVENVQATLQQLYLDAGTIFKRGIAECFSNLDRRFRSHDGWKIGGRVILSYAFSDSGSWNYNRNQHDTLRDIERTFLVLDGKTMPANYAGLAATVEKQRNGRYGRMTGYIETEYFRVRSFMNGNAHVWFKRDDLLDHVNRLLGEYYGAPIPEDRDAEADPLAEVKHTPAKRFGFFPTQPAAVREVIENTPLYRAKGEPRPRVLEPSAGTGNLARAFVEAGAVVDCVEIQAELARGLVADGFRTMTADFLAVRPETTGLYDIVGMNPPFDRERDIDHVVHALKFLKPGGYLVAIMSAGTEFRDTKKSVAFRALMEGMNAHWRDLPAGSFSSVGTNVNTVILRVYKDGHKFH